MYTVLIVDDNPLIRKGLINMIQWKKYNLRLLGEAEDGEQALSLAGNSVPDILITDMRMPKKDGLFLLEEFHTKYTETATIVISAYEEFQYVKSAVKFGSLNYILKPIDPEELNNTIKRAVDYREKIRLQSANLISIVSDLQSKAAEKTGTQNLFVFSVVFRVREQEDCPIDERILDPGLFSGFNANLYKKENVYICPVYGDSRENPENRKRFAEKLYGHLRAVTGAEVILGCSAGYHLRNFEDSYNEAKKACANSIYYNEEILLSDRLAADTGEGLNIEKHEDNLKLLIRSGNIPEAEKSVEEILAESRRLYPDNHHLQSRALIELLKVLLVADKKYFEPFRKIIRNVENQEEEILYFSVQEIRDDIFRVLAEMNYENAMNTNNLYNMINRIKDFINENYSKDIHLNYLSELFFISPSYLSRIFKAETGENILKYITGVRIAAAKELLKNTDEKIAKISELVGYSDGMYFNRVFKKTTGATPNEFRRKNTRRPPRGKTGWTGA